VVLKGAFCQIAARMTEGRSERAADRVFGFFSVHGAEDRGLELSLLECTQKANRKKWLFSLLPAVLGALGTRILEYIGRQSFGLSAWFEKS
jgi:hypothetical protein